jgi:hypothetical protein
MELIVILVVIVIALVAGIWATRKKPVENALEVLEKVTPPVEAKPAAKRQPKVVATTGKPKASKATGAKKPAVKAKTTRTRKTATK